MAQGLQCPGRGPKRGPVVIGSGVELAAVALAFRSRCRCREGNTAHLVLLADIDMQCGVDTPNLMPIAYARLRAHEG